MSHFSVLVITPTKPDDNELSRILQPYHEFECTGESDEYVRSIDKTAEAIAEYNSNTESMMRSSTGELVGAYEDQFYRDPLPEEKDKVGMGTGGGGGISWTSKDWGDGRGYRTKVHFVPDGWEEVNPPTKDVRTQAEWVADYHGVDCLFDERDTDIEDKHKYGYAIVDESGRLLKLIKRTNEDAKWDCWQLGGRWTGRLIPGYDPNEDPANKQTCWLCHGTGKRADMEVANGCNGCQGTGSETKWPTEWRSVSDQMMLCDVPIGKIRDVAEAKAAVEYDKMHSIIAGRDIITWEQAREKHKDKWDLAREEYNEQQVMKDLRAAGLCRWGGPDEFLVSRSAYLKTARDGALATFAVVKDGKWYERGNMGWWGCVSDEKDRNAWNEEFSKLIDGLPPSTWLSIIDCHI